MNTTVVPSAGGALVADGERFALDIPRLASPEASTPGGARPFGLRFALPAPADDRLPEWWLCPRTQIALTPDGVPWYRTVKNMEMSTSGPSGDGTGSTGGEEWRPDYQVDADMAALR